MKRRSFLTALLAPLVAPFIPKPKAEPKPYWVAMQAEYEANNPIEKRYEMGFQLQDPNAAMAVLYRAKDGSINY